MAAGFGAVAGIDGKEIWRVRVVKGILGGVLAGLAVTGLGGVVASVVLPLPARLAPLPEAAPVEAVASPPADAAPAVTPDADPRPLSTGDEGTRAAVADPAQPAADGSVAVPEVAVVPPVPPAAPGGDVPAPPDPVGDVALPQGAGIPEQPGTPLSDGAPGPDAAATMPADVPATGPAPDAAAQADVADAGAGAPPAAPARDTTAGGAPEAPLPVAAAPDDTPAALPPSRPASDVAARAPMPPDPGQAGGGTAPDLGRTGAGDADVGGGAASGGAGAAPDRLALARPQADAPPGDRAAQPAPAPDTASSAATEAAPRPQPASPPQATAEVSPPAAPLAPAATEGALPAAPMPDAAATAPEPAPVPEPELESAPRPDAEPAPETPPETPAGSAPAAVPDVGAAVAMPGRPVSGFGAPVAGVRVNRLPTIGPEAPASGSAVAAAAGDAAADDAMPDGPAIGAEDADAGATPADVGPDLRPALARNAVPFDNPEGRPLFSIIILDDDADPTARSAMARLTFPVTFAIDPMRADAREVAEFYRAAGHEVLLLASGIPEGATPSDLEITFAAHAAAIPVAVGVLDLPAGGFQNSNLLAQQIVTILAEEGYGLVTYERGLNPADQVAQSAGLGAGRVFRVLDAEDESPTTIRRYLERAAFKAAQEGEVIVMGRSRGDTIAGLMEWVLGGRVEAVALAPVSAALRR